MVKKDGEISSITDKESCSERQFKDLFLFPAWIELMDTFNTRLAITRDDLEIAENEEYYRLQGDARTLRFVLGIPDIIEAEFRARADDEKGKEDGTE